MGEIVKGILIEPPCYLDAAQGELDVHITPNQSYEVEADPAVEVEIIITGDKVPTLLRSRYIYIPHESPIPVTIYGTATYGEGLTIVAILDCAGLYEAHGTITIETIPNDRDVIGSVYLEILPQS